MSKNVDLRQLAVQRDQAPAPRGRRSKILTRYVLPGAVLLGFAGVLAWAARDSLLPAKKVTVVPVLSVQTEVLPEGTPLFQTAGWVEPMPTPQLITAETEGIVEELSVVAGQKVTKGQEIARMRSGAAASAVLVAKETVRLKEAELRSAEAARDAARVMEERPLQLREKVASAKAMLAQKRGDLGGIEGLLNAARVKEQQAQWNHERKQKATDVVPDSVIQEVASLFKVARETVKEYESRLEQLRLEVQALEEGVALLEERLRLKTEEKLARLDSEAKHNAAEATLGKARAELSEAERKLKLLTIKAPRDGRILALLAQPGSHDTRTIASLFDPKELQVRADVLFEHVPRIEDGQPVKIESRAAPGVVLDGTVLFSVSQADKEKATLQVKVAIKDPPSTLRPEMVVDVTFLAPRPPEGKSTAEKVVRLLVPRSLVETQEGGARIWVADQADGVARLKSVKLGLMSGELVIVLEGLNATDKVIAGGREGLKDGQRIEITGEESFSPKSRHH